MERRPDLYARLQEPRWPWSGAKEWLPEWGPREEIETGLPLLFGNITGPGSAAPSAFGVQYGKILRQNVEFGFQRREELLARPKEEADEEALNFLQETANLEGLGFQLRLERGDVLLVNNFAWMHGREAFPEEEADGSRRHIMRVWLRMRPDGGRFTA